MNGFAQRLIEKTAAWGLAARVAMLVAITTAAIAIVAAWRYSIVGPMGVWAAIVGGGICLAGALAALVIAGKVKGGPHARVSAVMAGMLFRMGAPLAALVFFQQRSDASIGGPLANAGVLTCLMLIYPVTLLAEVILVLPLVQDSSRPQHSPKTHSPSPGKA